MAAPPQKDSKPRYREHDQAHSHHHAECEKGNDHRWAVFGRESLQPNLARGPIAGGDEAAELGDFDRKEIPLLERIGQSDQHFACRLLALPARLDGREFGRLVVENVNAGKMTEHHLHRDHHGDEPEPPAQHGARLRHVLITQQVPGAGCRHAHAGRQEGGQQHVRPSNPHDGPSCNGPPVSGDNPAVDDRVTERHLHPTVVGEDPERREHGAQRDHATGEKVEPRRHAVATEEHDAEECCFQHEGRESLIAQQRPLDRSGALGHDAPVGAELEGHHDAADHAHAERQSKYLEPEVEDPPIELVAGQQPHAFERCKPCGEPDREGWEDDVKTYHKRELQP